jgi:hypothetical protein
VGQVLTQSGPRLMADAKLSHCTTRPSSTLRPDRVQWRGSAQSPILGPKGGVGAAAARDRGRHPAQTDTSDGPTRLRACLLARCRGYRFEEGRWHVSIWPVSCLDQSPQSRQHRWCSGAQRELESASPRQGAPTMTRHAITPRSSNYGLSVDLKGCAARLQQVGPTSA